MYSDRDIDNLYSTIDSCSSDIYDKRSQISMIDEKIERLKKTRMTVRNMKDEARILRADMESKRSELACQTLWTGAHMSLYQEAAGGLAEECSVYCGELDQIHDALDDEITRLRNTIADLEGTISWLRRTINNCWNWICKMLN